MSIESKRTFRDGLREQLKFWADARLEPDPDGEDIHLGAAYSVYVGWCQHKEREFYAWDDFPKALSEAGYPACMVWEDPSDLTAGIGIILATKWRRVS
jgi:hypothetical protein